MTEAEVNFHGLRNPFIKTAKNKVGSCEVTVQKTLTRQYQLSRGANQSFQVVPTPALSFFGDGYDCNYHNE